MENYIKLNFASRDFNTILKEVNHYVNVRPELNEKGERFLIINIGALDFTNRGFERKVVYESSTQWTYNNLVRLINILTDKSSVLMHKLAEFHLTDDEYLSKNDDWASYVLISHMYYETEHMISTINTLMLLS